MLRILTFLLAVAVFVHFVRWFLGRRKNRLQSDQVSELLSHGLAKSSARSVEFNASVLKHVERRCIDEFKKEPHLVFTIGHALSDLKPTTVAEADRVVDDHALRNLRLKVPCEDAWHPDSLRQFIEELTADKWPCMYLQRNHGEWEFLELRDCFPKAGKALGNRFSLRTVSVDVSVFDLRFPVGRNVLVLTSGTRDQVNSIRIRVDGEADRSETFRPWIKAAAAYTFPRLLGCSAPSELLAAIKSGESMDLMTEDHQVKFLHRVGKPYWTEPEQVIVELTFTRILLTKGP